MRYSCFSDKAVSEEEYNEKNKHHFLPEESYRLQALSASETRFEVSGTSRMNSIIGLENR